MKLTDLKQRAIVLIGCPQFHQLLPAFLGRPIYTDVDVVRWVGDGRSLKDVAAMLQYHMEGNWVLVTLNPTLLDFFTDQNAIDMFHFLGHDSSVAPVFGRASASLLVDNEPGETVRLHPAGAYLFN